jgi:CheY-like chemotaxis protein
MADESGSNPNQAADQPSVLPFDADSSPSELLNVLVAEDNRADVHLIRLALEETGMKHQIRVANNGEKAANFFDRVSADPALPCPHLVILDLNLPKMRGPEVLEHIRHSKRCRQALVVVVSTSESAQEQQEMASLGADAYFKKPSSYDEFMKLGTLIRTLVSRKN